ncbi:MAG TPA: isocitrate lyase/phosphoenolpyruvate mutase family protein [Jatrophihabitantaceae bacterium]|jgi:2-methylisocitrate lyase-like PEP mutase family enzyme
MTSQQDKAELFHALHTNDPVLVLANAWDVASARIVESAGAAAVATTSAGVAWSLGYPDGDALDLDRAVDLIARVVAAVDVPVTADIESGYADDAAGVGRTIGRVLAAGAVGVNLEDAYHGGDAPLRTVADQTERIAAARAAADDAGIALYINARIDTYLRSVGDPAGRLQETIDRAGAYLEAGASGIFVPGTTEQATVAKLVAGIAAPVNLLVGPGAPPVPELGKLGVARVSAGSSIAAAAYSLARAAAIEMATSGGYETITGELEYGSINALFG